MKIRIWGARGSIPVSGQEFVRYGGDTTCVEIETARGDVIILDAGSGIRTLGNKLLNEGRTEFHFLFSHAHWDHLLGFPFFKPLYRKDSFLHFHGCTFAQESIKTILKETMRAPFFPVDLSAVLATLKFDRKCLPEFEVAGLRCQSIPLNHPNKGYGFRLYEGDRSIAIFPDNELSFPHPNARPIEEYVKFVSGADVLLHDAEYLPGEYESFSKGWGHSVYSDTVRLGIDSEVDHLILFHLNQERTDDQVDEMAKKARSIISETGVNMSCEYAYTGLEMVI